MRKRWALLAPAVCVLVAGQLSLAGTVATAAPAANTAVKTVAPNKTMSEVDCFGDSPKYKSLRISSDLCTDPISLKNGKAGRFYDPSWRYQGHDEPSVKFISNAPNSANTFSYLYRLPIDPAKSPTNNGSVTDYGQLSVAPWFGLPMCDPKSYPQNPCTPDSDSNLGAINNPADAGSAFMELQFYPPGYTPFMDNTSCSPTKWCAAVTIDSLEADAAFNLNPNCTEPVNFAYLQTNGIPAGPPSPQLQDISSDTPNAHTLEINPGDALAVSITDPAAGFTTTVHDLTTGQTGWMTASAANGFMNTNLSDCSGTPFTFHAEYNTAKQQNQVPWAALEGGVLVQQEIGHSEVCSSFANQDPFSETFADGQSYTDNNTFDTCQGGSDPGSTGENPANFATAETQGLTGPQLCPTQGDLCEYGDGFCFAKGTRTAQINGQNVTEYSAANECLDTRFQNGDLDFDGLDYQSFSWPDGTANHPTSEEVVGPFDSSGHMYPTIQFESNAAGSEFLCNTSTGQDCTTPPLGSHFYPYWSLTRTSDGLGTSLTGCEWTFGNTIPHLVNNFGRYFEYGKPDVARFGGTQTSNPMPNPQFGRACTSV